MHKYSKSKRGKVRKQFSHAEGETSYFNIKLYKHVIASNIKEKYIDGLVDGYNAIVEGRVKLLTKVKKEPAKKKLPK